jgi:FolB domain-containing protein
MIKIMKKIMTANSFLEISGLLLDVKIGCYDFEKNIKQKIEIDILIKFQNIPEIFITDDLNDGIDYDLMIKFIEHYSNESSYETVEKWCYEIFQLIKKKYDNISHLQIKIKKNPIDIKNLKNGIIISYEEKFDN